MDTKTVENQFMFAALYTCVGKYVHIIPWYIYYLFSLLTILWLILI